MQECRSSVHDQRPITTELKYVGLVKDILELNYRSIKKIVLLCDTEGRNAAMRIDATDSHWQTLDAGVENQISRSLFSGWTRFSLQMLMTGGNA